MLNEIHEIVFHGKGGYDWGTIYNMPIWLRRFTFHKIKEYYTKQEELSNSSNIDINNPNANKTNKVYSPPVYSTKATPRK